MYIFVYYTYVPQSECTVRVQAETGRDEVSSAPI